MGYEYISCYIMIMMYALITLIRHLLLRHFAGGFISSEMFYMGRIATGFRLDLGLWLSAAFGPCRVEVIGIRYLYVN